MVVEMVEQRKSSASNFSVIVICKNEVQTIERTIQSVLSLTDDIVVYDSGSTDGTVELLRKFPVRLHQGCWDGFGRTRQKAVELSKHNWVLIVDADEVVSEELKKEIQQLDFSNEKMAHSIQLINFIGDKKISYGSLRNDFRIRLYNKNQLKWNDASVHEKLIVPSSITVKKLTGVIEHYTAKNFEHLSAKLKLYAALTAEEYHKKKKKSTWLKRNFAGSFAFIKSYVFNFGFLDGRAGYQLAKILSNYTRLKYQHLYQLQSKK